MTAVPLGDKPNLLIYGGISHRAATDTLEVRLCYTCTNVLYVRVVWICVFK
jgi:hypothetical protein